MSRNRGGVYMKPDEVQVQDIADPKLYSGMSAIAIGLVLASSIILNGCHPKNAQLVPVTHVIASDTRVISGGKFVVVAFHLDTPTHITVSVTLKSGPSVDSYLVTEQGLETFRAIAANRPSRGFSAIGKLSEAPLTGSYTRLGLIAAGNHALIVDNSNLGVTAPSSQAFKRSSALVTYALSAEEFPIQPDAIEQLESEVKRLAKANLGIWW